MKKVLTFFFITALITSLCGCVSLEDNLTSRGVDEWEPAEFVQAADGEDEKTAAKWIFMDYDGPVPAAQMCQRDNFYYLNRIEEDGAPTGETGLYQYNRKEKSEKLLARLDDGEGTYWNLVACEAGVYWLREKNPNGSFAEELSIMKYDDKKGEVREIRTLNKAWRMRQFGYEQNKIYRFGSEQDGDPGVYVFDETTDEEKICIKNVTGGSEDFIQIHDGLLGVVEDGDKVIRYELGSLEIRDGIRVKLEDACSIERLAVNDRYAVLLTAHPASGKSANLLVYDYVTEKGFAVSGWGEMAEPKGILYLDGEKLICETVQGLFYALDLEKHTWEQLTCVYREEVS